MSSRKPPPSTSAKRRKAPTMYCTTKATKKISTFSATVRRVKERDPRIDEEANQRPQLVCETVRGNHLHPHLCVDTAFQPRQRKDLRVATPTLQGPRLLTKTTEQVPSTASK